MSNPHIDEAKANIQVTDGMRLDRATFYVALAQTEALLAIAYEQRTANLIALFDMGGENFDSREIKYGTLVTQIAERLGVKK